MKMLFNCCKSFSDTVRASAIVVGFGGRVAFLSLESEPLAFNIERVTIYLLLPAFEG